MTIESRPGRLLHPKPKRWYTPLPPRKRRPKLPIGVGKAQQMRSGAIILGDDEQASWVDLVVKANRVTGKPEHLVELKKRLDAVMQPLPDRSPPTTVT